MNRVASGALTAVWLAAASFAATTPPSLTDGVLEMYQLSPAEEAQFNAHDGKMSDFWSKWDTANATKLTLDYIDMTSCDAAYSWNEDPAASFVGCNDAQLEVRAAYTSRGVYFEMLVEDNVWVPYSYWGSDVVHVYLDTLSQPQVANPNYWFNPTQWALTYSSKLIEVPAGSLPVDTFVSISFSKPAGVITTDTEKIDDPARDGMTMEMVRLDSTHHCQEWYIPWSQWGFSAPPANTNPPKALAFTVGYDDVDDTAGVSVKILEWQGLCDPFCQPPNSETWGEVEMGPALDAVLQSRIVDKVCRPANQPGPRSSQLYTLQGAKITNPAATGLVVRRAVLANGTRSAALDLSR